MSARHDRSGALLAGGLLLGMPAIDVLVAGTPPGVPHFAVALLGALLLGKAFVTFSPTRRQRQFFIPRSLGIAQNPRHKEDRR